MPSSSLLKPGFLKRLDKWLLTHRPVSWSTRIHSALFYGLAFLLFIAVMAFIAPDDPRSNSTIYNWEVLLTVISLLAFIFWLIFLLRFNVFKRFGKWGPFDSLKTFGFYFIIILVFVIGPFVPRVIQSLRAGMKYSTAELVSDVNRMNTMICQLERDSIDVRFASDTLQLSAEATGTVKKTLIENDVVIYHDHYYLVDSMNLQNRLTGADSIQKISDSLYIVYECPDFKFVDTYAFPYVVNKDLLSSMDLYQRFLKPKNPVDKPAVTKELETVIKKYERKGSFEYQYYTTDYSNTYETRRNTRYRINAVNNSLENISQRKYRLDIDYYKIVLRVAFYITLGLTLLVFVYRHSTRKTFFLSLLAIVVISILTTLAIAMTGGDQAFFWWYLFYFFLFGILSFLVFSKRKRDVVTGIALNLFVLMINWVPLIMVALYYNIARRQSRSGSSLIPFADEYPNEKLHYQVAEVAGFVLLLLLIAFLIQRAYRKWYALPEQ